MRPVAEHLVPVSVRRATIDDALEHVIDAVLARARTARGGEALLTQLWGPSLAPEALRAAIRLATTQGTVWIALLGDDIVAGALVRDRCVQVIWVEPTQRRHRVATTLLEVLLEGEDPPLDAWALPGDRATKSLYESVGWKARLLTMRGA